MHTVGEHLKGLYAITDPALQPPQALCERVSLAIEGGATIIQYRDKSGNAGLRLEQAAAIASLCRERGACCIINDDVALAAACGAHGVHLGRDDADLAAARRALGEQAIIGASCYNSLETAQAAVDQGADYLAFGRFFASQTKPGAVQADPALIIEARRRWALPVAAIGGISPDNAGLLLDAGADMLAVVRGVFAATDVRRAASRYASLFHRSRKHEHLNDSLQM